MKKFFYLLALIVITLFLQSYAIAQSYPATEQASLKSKKCFPKTGMGFDLGVGESAIGMHIGGHKYQLVYPVFAAGVRGMHYFNPYLGVDFIKINFSSPFQAKTYIEFMNLQFMTGVRGNTPTFFKCMSGYSAVRLGYGARFVNGVNHGIAFETEIGLNLTRNVFVGFSYNLLSLFVNYPYGYYNDHVNLNTYAFRLGFNFGK